MGDSGSDADPVSSEREPDPLGTFRGFFALSGDVFVLSVAMFAFSLGFQTTGRYMPVYLDALGAGAVVVGLYRTVGDLIGAVYPYPGGALSDRIGSRTALTLFGLASTAGFAVWWAAGDLSSVGVGPPPSPWSSSSSACSSRRRGSRSGWGRRSRW